MNAGLQIVTEVNGCLVVNMPKYQSGDSIMFAAGPRWTPRTAHRFSPFIEALLGGRRITHDVQDPLKREELLDAWNKGDLPHFPKRSDYMAEYQAFGFAMKMGGGFDAVFRRAFAWRVFDLAYTHSWLRAVDPLNASQGGFDQFITRSSHWYVVTTGSLCPNRARYESVRARAPANANPPPPIARATNPLVHSLPS